MFEAPGRGVEADHVKLIDTYVLESAAVANRLIVDAADEAGVAYVNERACTSNADCDDATGGLDITPSVRAEKDVVTAREIYPGPITHGYVIIAG